MVALGGNRSTNNTGNAPVDITASAVDGLCEVNTDKRECVSLLSLVLACFGSTLKSESQELDSGG